MEKRNMIRDLRLQRAWSQEELAEISGLSVRTIQRLEGGAKAGLDSLKAIASAFGVDVIQLQQESNEMQADSVIEQQEPPKKRAEIRSNASIENLPAIYLL